jgi:hypothetical protein
VNRSEHIQFCSFFFPLAQLNSRRGLLGTCPGVKFQESICSIRAVACGGGVSTNDGCKASPCVKSLSSASLPGGGGNTSNKRGRVDPNLLRVL